MTLKTFDLISAEAFKNLLFAHGRDIKAEVLAGLLIDAGFTADVVRAGFCSAFLRPFVPDVSQVIINPSQQEFLFKLSRNGMYDQLPQSLFHKNYSLMNFESLPLKKVVQQLKTIAKEEHNARKLFAPFENEFFFQLLMAEQRKKHAATDISAIPFLFKNRLPDKLPGELAAKFYALFPSIASIAGNIAKAEKYLQYLFNEEIRIKNTHNKTFVEHFCQLGSSDSLIPGTALDCYFPQLLVCIDVQHHATTDFLPWKPEKQLLDLCLKYLLPFDAEINIVLRESKSESLPQLGTKAASSCRIGYDLSL